MAFKLFPIKIKIVYSVLLPKSLNYIRFKKKFNVKNKLEIKIIIRKLLFNNKIYYYKFIYIYRKMYYNWFLNEYRPKKEYILTILNIYYIMIELTIFILKFSLNNENQNLIELIKFTYISI